MKFNAFYKWLSKTFGGLTLAAAIEHAGIDVTAGNTVGNTTGNTVGNTTGNTVGNTVGNTAIDISALDAGTPGDNDLFIFQTGSTRNKITFADLVTAITTKQGA